MLRALTHSGLYRRAALPLLRGFASGGGVPSASSTPQDLFSVVTREIRYEKEDNSSDKQLAEMREALAADWKVVSPVGSAQVTLTSKNVRLDLDITPVEVDNSDDMQEGAEGEEEEGGSEGYRMMVSIDGGKGKTMRFACTIADGLTIHQAQLFDTDKLPNIYTSLSNESVRAARRKVWLACWLADWGRPGWLPSFPFQPLSHPTHSLCQFPLFSAPPSVPALHGPHL
jgi:hypothetical protein